MLKPAPRPRGAPFNVVDMKVYFAISYLRSFYRGTNLSLSILFNEVLKVRPAFAVAGNSRVMTKRSLFLHRRASLQECPTKKARPTLYGKHTLKLGGKGEIRITDC